MKYENCFYLNRIFYDAIHYKTYTWHFPSDQRFLCKQNTNQTSGAAPFSTSVLIEVWKDTDEKCAHHYAFIELNFPKEQRNLKKICRFDLITTKSIGTAEPKCKQAFAWFRSYHSAIFNGTFLYVCVSMF